MLTHKGLEVKEKTQTMLVGVAGATTANVGLNSLMIPQYGYMGAATATLLSFVGYLIFAAILTERHVPWRLPLRTLRNVAMSATAMAVCVWFVYSLAGSSLLRLVTGALVAGVVYFIGLYATNELTEQELLTIRNVIIGIL
jgi:O-antigen/teichoic acid export membrane protein